MMKVMNVMGIGSLLVIGFLAMAGDLPAGRVVTGLDSGWKFSLGDDPAAKDAGFDDSDWRVLDLPHDWAFEGDFKPDGAQTDKGGYKPGGIGWYRREFNVPDGLAGRRVWVEFDGVYMDSTVWINGVELGGWPYGYMSFGFELTPQLRPGRNVLAVRVDNSKEPSARWYHGCGIYAHVNLVATEAMRVDRWGVCITTPGVSAREATVAVETTLEGVSGGKVGVETVILDPGEHEVAKARAAVAGWRDGRAVLKQALKVAKPQRWDVSTPRLYTAVTRLVVDGVVVDETRTRFGIRTIRWDSATGFHLNGRQVKLKGVCEHLEGGPVGAAWPDGLIRWKVKLLKEMGCNAIRVAHNPQVPAFYRICDEEGMLVMDEIFDGWKRKAPEDYGARFFDDWWQRDLRAWIRRDRNHPCVVIWSLGNETGGVIGRELVRVCHEMDPTRPVTSGHSGSEFMDVFGVNGHSEKQHFFSSKRPDKPFIATEAPHTWQVRGYYRTKTWYRDGYPNKRQDPAEIPDLTEKEVFTYDWIAPELRQNRKQVFNSSYDNATVRITARENWEKLRDLDWYAGHFRWTGFDYLGEAGYVHGGWPFRAFMGGVIDLAGFRKDHFHFYASQWTSEPMVQVLPHWTHPKMEAGTKIPVWVYSNCEEVELSLNGKSLGRRKPGMKWREMQCEWLVPWAPGTIEAVGFRGGKPVARQSRETAGAAAGLQVDVETCAAVPRQPGLAIVTVAEVDEGGRFDPYGENRVHFHLEGAVKLLSLENGSPVDTEANFGTSSRRAFFGLTRAFLAAKDGEGSTTLVVGAICGDRSQLRSDRVRIDVQDCSLSGEGGAGRELRIFYTLDGSKPTLSSSPFGGAFTVKPGTTVRALVTANGRELFEMSERFAADEGIYWGGTGDVAASPDAGEQAEDAGIKGGTVKSKGGGFHGKGYVDFGSREGHVEWYQENDGSAGKFRLEIRYALEDPDGGRPMDLIINGKKVEKISFTNTGSWDGDWKVIEASARLESGANRIRLQTAGQSGPNLDELKVE